MARVKKMIWKIILVVVVLAVLLVIGMMLYGKRQMGKIPGLSAQDTIAYSAKGKPSAVITVGIMQNGGMSIAVYGEDGKELPPEMHTYEIGSITKTVTATLVSKAVREGKIDINAPIDRYLSLPAGKHYPTVAALLTHTSGYKSYYFETPMIGNFFAGRNSFMGISKSNVLKRISETELADKAYTFAYSNFGYAVLGLVLEAVYDADYTELANHYLQAELGLEHTKISDGTGDLGNYWAWQANDAYIAAGAVTSNIQDMLGYLAMQFGGNADIARTHERMKGINATSEMYAQMGIRLDDIGMAWIMDRESGIIWHNGGTGKYNAFMGVHPDSQTGVVVLSNLSPSDRIPATVTGVKLLKDLL